MALEQVGNVGILPVKLVNADTFADIRTSCETASPEGVRVYDYSDYSTNVREGEVLSITPNAAFTVIAIGGILGDKVQVSQAIGELNGYQLGRLRVFNVISGVGLTVNKSGYDYNSDFFAGNNIAQLHCPTTYQVLIVRADVPDVAKGVYLTY